MHFPVNWYPWGDAAFTRAKREDNSILRYSTGYWCHVMKQERFDEPEVGRALNEYVAAIKAGREERPDIDPVVKSPQGLAVHRQLCSHRRNTEANVCVGGKAMARSAV